MASTGLRASALAALLAAGALAPAAASYAPLGFPGAAWGGASRDLSGLEGYGTQGWLKQGVTWVKLPWDMPVRTFASYQWRFRTENRRFYNEHGPGVSLELSKAFVDLGLELAWQRYPELGRRNDQYELFASWYRRVDLARGAAIRPLGIPIRGLPLSSWGRLAHDMNGIEGDGTQGWVSQGVDWARLPGGVSVTTFAAYRWRFRSENRPFYNMQGPAAGLEFGRGPVQAGFEHAWRRYPELGRFERAFQFYITWYSAWDLGHRR